MIFRLLLCLVAAGGVLLLGGCRDKAKEEQRVRFRDIMHGNTPDADITAAIAKARETLPQFLAAIEKPAPGQGQFIVRKPFPAEGGKQQILWITSLTYDGKLLHGRIDDNTVQKGVGVPRDGVVSFPPTEIADWMFNENGKAVGGYMLRVFKKKFPEEWAAQRYDEKLQFKE